MGTGIIVANMDVYVLRKYESRGKLIKLLKLIITSFVCDEV